MEATFNPEMIHEIFKAVWGKTIEEEAAKEDEVNTEVAAASVTAAAPAAKKSKPTSAQANALKLSCELLRIFVVEGIQRAGMIAETEGMDEIGATHFERILPQLLLDF